MKLAMLSYDPPVWAVESTFAEKDVVKKAGAWWHPGKPCERQRTCLACRAGIGKSWWTKDDSGWHFRNIRITPSRDISAPACRLR